MGVAGLLVAVDHHDLGPGPPDDATRRSTASSRGAWANDSGLAFDSDPAIPESR